MADLLVMRGVVLLERDALGREQRAPAGDLAVDQAEEVVHALGVAGEHHAAALGQGREGREGARAEVHDVEARLLGRVVGGERAEQRGHEPLSAGALRAKDEQVADLGQIDAVEELALAAGVVDLAERDLAASGPAGEAVLLAQVVEADAPRERVEPQAPGMLARRLGGAAELAEHRGELGVAGHRGR